MKKGRTIGEIGMEIYHKVNPDLNAAHSAYIAKKEILSFCYCFLFGPGIFFLTGALFATIMGYNPQSTGLVLAAIVMAMFLIMEAWMRFAAIRSIFRYCFRNSRIRPSNT